MSLKVSDLDIHFERAIDDTVVISVPPHVCGAIMNCPGDLVHGRIVPKNGRCRPGRTADRNQPQMQVTFPPERQTAN
jgi:hypothetical protein